MGNYGSGTAKRHAAWSNDQDFIGEIAKQGGFLSAADRKALGPSNLSTHYWDPKVGKMRYTGSLDHLRGSQTFSLQLHTLVCGQKEIG